jgi:hypothetical protein
MVRRAAILPGVDPKLDRIRREFSLNIVDLTHPPDDVVDLSRGPVESLH